MRTILKSVVALTAVSAVCFSATDASAFGHRRGGSSGGSWGSSGGSYGSWGSSGGSWGSSGGSSGGSWGSSGGHYRVHYRGHSSGGNWGSSGGSSGGYSSWSGGSSGGSSGGYDGGVIHEEGYHEMESEMPAAPASPTPAAPDEAAEGKSAFTGAGVLLVKVPTDAKIFVNGKATTTTGTERQFVSRGLVRGATYNYEVRAEMVRDGEPVTITKTARLTAGGNAELAFSETDSETIAVVADEPLTTKLVVRVPNNARVFLAGNETKQTGETREFSTSRLVAGEGWNDYTVRVEFENDGKLLSKEQVVSINAGEEKEISFDFADGANDGRIVETAQK